MKKVLKWILILILVLLVGMYLTTKFMSSSLPEGIPGVEAESLTDKILQRVNKPAWDSLHYVSWTFFRGEHHYTWDKKANKALIEWEDIQVVMDLETLDAKITKSGSTLAGKELEIYKDLAWKFWCNDSFWLYAPYKLRDDGVTRSIVEQDGKQGLLVSYESGGATPGDSYLWWVDESGLPTSFDMWTSILPVKGMSATWSEWQKLEGGALVAKTHKLGPMQMSISNLKAGQSLESIGMTETLFAQ